MFVIECAHAGKGNVTHMALLYKSQVYECTTTGKGACIDRGLDQFMANKSGKIFYLFGPQ